MAQKSPKTKSKQTAHKSASDAQKATQPKMGLRRRFGDKWARFNDRRHAFIARRPHRSFQRTPRRDYARGMKMPGYYAFTVQVAKTLYQHRRTFLALTGVYALLIIVMGGVTNQETYTQISDLIKESGSSLGDGGLAQLGQAALLLTAAFASGPSGLSTDQQIYLAIMLLFVWLSTVWLLREYKLGRKPKMRDGLYNSGAPFISTLFVLLLLVCQLLPIGIVALVYAALSSVGIVGDGFGSMLFWVIAALVTTLVLYWITSTIIALVVVTLPGMYPWRAVKAASDLVVGRRLRIMYRLVWGAGTVVLAWAVVMIPLILLDTWVKSFWSFAENIPLMPFAAAVMSAVSVVWLASYVYLFYRKVVDDATPPA